MEGIVYLRVSTKNNKKNKQTHKLELKVAFTLVIVVEAFLPLSTYIYILGYHNLYWGNAAPVALRSTVYVRDIYHTGCCLLELHLAFFSSTPASGYLTLKLSRNSVIFCDFYFFFLFFAQNVRKGERLQ